VLKDMSWVEPEKLENVSRKAPFFIVGCPRSGTTLLQVLLDSHPDITIPPESHIFERFSQFFSDYGDLDQHSNLQRFVRDILHDVAIKDWNLGISVFQFCEQIERCTVRDVIGLLFKLYAKNEGKSRWGDKTPQHALFLREIKEVFPEAKIIHLIRDGRDVAESLQRVYIGPKSAYRIAHRWRKYILAFEKFKKEFSPDEFMEVRYEDLVRTPMDTLRKIQEFLSLDRFFANPQLPSTERKKYYIKQSALHTSLKNSISANKIGIFKRKLSNREVEIFESIAGDLLELAGYQLVTDGKTRLRLAEKVHFFTEDYVYRYLRKIFHLNGLRQAKIQLMYDLQFYVRKLRQQIHTIFSRLGI